ncbi:hypothetical protein N4G58_14545 [Edwardsiella piscicida]|nr:hypothetical protein N4G58_14545 [Edwardsiella piscicida]
MTEPTTPPDKAAAAETTTEQAQPLERAHKQDKQIVKNPPPVARRSAPLPSYW